MAVAAGALGTQFCNHLATKPNVRRVRESSRACAEVPAPVAGGAQDPDRRGRVTLQDRAVPLRSIHLPKLARSTTMHVVHLERARVIEPAFAASAPEHLQHGASKSCVALSLALSKRRQVGIASGLLAATSIPIDALTIGRLPSPHLLCVLRDLVDLVFLKPGCVVDAPAFDAVRAPTARAILICSEGLQWFGLATLRASLLGHAA